MKPDQAYSALKTLERRYRNTWVRWEPHVPDEERSVQLVLHSTIIVEVRGDGSVRLHSGGWRTVTTKKRINEALELLGHPRRVYQVKRQWYASEPDGHAADYEDGMILREMEVTS